MFSGIYFVLLDLRMNRFFCRWNSFSLGSYQDILWKYEWTISFKIKLRFCVAYISEWKMYNKAYLTWAILAWDSFRWLSMTNASICFRGNFCSGFGSKPSSTFWGTTADISPSRPNTINFEKMKWLNKLWSQMIRSYAKLSDFIL